jgi:hypothetical protein
LDFSGWEESGENTKVYDREELEEAVETLFSSDCINDEGKDELKSADEFLMKAVAERSFTYIHIFLLNDVFDLLRAVPKSQIARQSLHLWYH